jgi:STE24 endopeptidase
MTAPLPSEVAAWLNGLGAQRLHEAAQLTDLRHWDAVIGCGLLLLAAFVVFQSRVLEKLSGRMQRSQRRPWFATAACILILGVVLAFVSTTWSGYGVWREAQIDGHGSSGLMQSLIPAWRGVGPMLFALLVGVSALYALMRLAPRFWWLMAGATCSAFFFATVWAPDALAPGATSMPQAPSGAVREAVASFIANERLPADGVRVSPRSGLDVDVVGDAQHMRVDLTQAMLAEPAAEARAAVGHVMGHHAHRDMLSFAALLSALAFVGFFAADRLYRPLGRLMGAWRDMKLADPAGLPVMAVIGVLWLAAAGVAQNNFVRLINVAADQYSLDHAREPDGLRLWLTRDWKDDRPDPGVLEEVIFYDHPSLASRFAHIATWQAAHAKPPPSPAAPEAVQASRGRISGRSGG